MDEKATNDKPQGSVWPAVFGVVLAGVCMMTLDIVQRESLMGHAATTPSITAEK